MFSQILLPSSARRSSPPSVCNAFISNRVCTALQRQTMGHESSVECQFPAIVRSELYRKYSQVLIRSPKYQYIEAFGPLKIHLSLIDYSSDAWRVTCLLDKNNRVNGKPARKILAFKRASNAWGKVEVAPNALHFIQGCICIHSVIHLQPYASRGSDLQEQVMNRRDSACVSQIQGLTAELGVPMDYADPSPGNGSPCHSDATCRSWGNGSESCGVNCDFVRTCLLIAPNRDEPTSHSCALSLF